MNQEQQVVEEPQEEVQEEQSYEEQMWNALQDDFDYERPRRGDILDGVVIDKEEDQIVVDIGLKKEGIVPSKDLEKLGEEAVEDVEVGDEVKVYVLKPETYEGEILVSLNMARAAEDWEHAHEVMESGEIFESEVTGYNKGGLLAPFGHLQGFIPRSHVVNLSGRTDEGPPMERLAQMVGREVQLKVIEVDRRQRRLIMSERAARREWRAKQKERLLDSLEEGDIVRGAVSNLTDFGAFVDLGGADGLIHISELSWDRVDHAREVLEVGQDVDVYVLRVDEDRKRIGLSLKQLKPDPWTTVEEDYDVGELVEGRITNVVDFGAFAKIAEGIEGLIHISELSDENIGHSREVVGPGDGLMLQIISIDAERRRMGLSLRRVPPSQRTDLVVEEPEEEVTAEAAVEDEEPQAAAVAAEEVEEAEGPEEIEEPEGTLVAEAEEPQEAEEPAEAPAAEVEGAEESAEVEEPAEAPAAEVEEAEEPEEIEEPGEALVAESEEAEEAREDEDETETEESPTAEVEGEPESVEEVVEPSGNGKAVEEGEEETEEQVVLAEEASNS